MFGRWLKREKGARAARQQGDPHALDREGDPRGGVQSEEYRTADPRDIVEEDGVVMTAPVEPRRKESRFRSVESATGSRRRSRPIERLRMDQAPAPPLRPRG